MAASRFRALSYLAYRALLAHPLKRVRQRGDGLDRFLASYGGNGLVPTDPDDRAIGEAASACIGCGLCEVRCELAPAVHANAAPATATAVTAANAARNRSRLISIPPRLVAAEYTDALRA